MNKFKFGEMLQRYIDESNFKPDSALFKQDSDLVFESGNPYFICDFLELVPALDFPSFMDRAEQILFEEGDVMHIYEFAFCMVDSGKQAFDVDGRLSRFENKIIESRNPKLMYYFAAYIPGADVEKFGKALAKDGNVKYCKMFLEHFKGELPSELVDELKKSIEDEEMLLRVGVRIPASLIKIVNKSHDFDEVAKKVLNSGDAYLITELAENDPRVQTRLPQFVSAVIATKDVLNIYEFAASVPGLTTPDIALLQNAVIESGMAKYMFYMAEYVPGVDVKKLSRAIRLTGNKKYIELINEKFGESNSEDEREKD